MPITLVALTWTCPLAGAARLRGLRRGMVPGTTRSGATHYRGAVTSAAPDPGPTLGTSTGRGTIALNGPTGATTPMKWGLRAGSGLHFIGPAARQGATVVTRARLDSALRNAAASQRSSSTTPSQRNNTGWPRATVLRRPKPLLPAGPTWRRQKASCSRKR